jgi:cytochrome c553
MLRLIGARGAAAALTAAVCLVALLVVADARAQGSGTGAVASGTPTPTPSAVKPPPFVEQLAWAYAITPGPAAPAPADDGTKLTLPGADKSFTLDQIRNRMGPADWFPGDHPSMPSVVAIGREQAGIWACSLCHYPNGKGRPENAGIAGLNRDYFIQQLHDFKNGARQSADGRKPNTACR